MRVRSWGGGRRWGVVGVVAALTAGGVAVAAWGEGFEDSRVSLADGGAWLASPQQGLVTLLNGPAQQVVGSVLAPGAQRGDPLSVVQSRASAYVVNGGQGTVTRVDGATYETSAPFQFGEVGGSPLSVYAGGQALYVVDSQRRTASVTDPVTMRVREQLSLAAQPGADQSVVDQSGRLWVIDQHQGGLTWFDPGKRVRPEGAQASDRLVLVQGRPVLVDVDRARLGALSDAGEVPDWSCLDVRAGDQVQLLGSQTSDRVFATVPGTGTLVAGTVGRDRCELSVGVGRAGDELGPLVESGRFVFVPNRTSGRTVVVDVDAGRVVADLAVVAPGARLELLAEDGFVFYHDVDGADAGVISFEGGRWQVGRSLRKYDESDTGAGILTPTDEDPPGGGEDPGEEDPGEDPAEEDPGEEDPPTDGEDPPADGAENPPDGDDDPPGGGQNPPGDENPPGGGDPAAVVLTATRQGTGGTLTATPAGGATAECDPLCSFEVNPGTSVTMQAIADPGNEISGWTGVDGCGNDTTCTVTVDGDRSVAVLFAEQLVSLTVAASGNGTVTGGGIDCPPTCTATVSQGTQITLTADPAGNAEISWGGDCGGTAATCTLAMDGDRSVSVTFAALVELTVTTGGDGEGTVTGGGIDCPPTCTATVSQGSQITLTADPARGAEFGGWGGNCSGAAATCTLTMDGDRAVSATFDDLLALGIHFQGRSGRVVVDPGGSDCEGGCVFFFRPGTQITLTGVPLAPGDSYGWAGPLGFECNDLIDTPCTFVLDDDFDVGVNFFQN